MIKALLLIFEPTSAWGTILRARRGVASVLVAFLVPLLAITSACEAYGLIHWGKWQGPRLMHFGKWQSEVPYFKKFSVSEAVIVEAVQLLLSLAVVFGGAHLVKSIGETYRGRHTYTQAFTAVAYGLSPLFLLRVFDAFAGVHPAVTWGIGIILSIAVLYQGVPRMMEPDPAHAFGLYITSALLLTFITAVARFVTAAYVGGKFPKLEAIVSDITTRLPF